MRKMDEVVETDDQVVETSLSLNMRACHHTRDLCCQRAMPLGNPLSCHKE